MQQLSGCFSSWCQTIQSGYDNLQMVLNVHQPSSLEKHVFEPMASIIKVALVAFCKKGTKLFFADNQIWIQEPGLFQGITRTMGSNSRANISILVVVIKTAFLLYPPDTASRKVIYAFCVKGLKKLRETYTESLSREKQLVDRTYIDLSLCVQMIENVLEQPEQQRENRDMSLVYSETVLEKIRNAELWKELDENLASNLLQNLERAAQQATQEVAGYKKSLEGLAEGKERTFLQPQPQVK